MDSLSRSGRGTHWLLAAAFAAAAAWALWRLVVHRQADVAVWRSVAMGLALLGFVSLTAREVRAALGRAENRSGGRSTEPPAA